MSTVRVTHMGMEGEGKTLAQAKAAAGRKAERALTGDYTPVAIVHAGSTAVVVRDPHTGWGYALIHPEEKKPSRNLYASSSGADTKKEDVIASAAWHLAQNAGHYQGIESLIPEAKRRELDSYFAQQDIYKHARAEGKTDEEARDIAFSRRP